MLLTLYWILVSFWIDDGRIPINSTESLGTSKQQIKRFRQVEQFVTTAICQPCIFNGLLIQ